MTEYIKKTLQTQVVSEVTGRIGAISLKLNR